jgi:hypothetical protein
MNIVNRLPDGLPLMNDQSLAAGLVMQRKGAGQNIDNIGDEYARATRYEARWSA